MCVCVCVSYLLSVLSALSPNNIIKRSFSFSFTFAFVFSQCIPVTQQPPLSFSPPPFLHMLN